MFSSGPQDGIGEGVFSQLAGLDWIQWPYSPSLFGNTLLVLNHLFLICDVRDILFSFYTIPEGIEQLVRT